MPDTALPRSPALLDAAGAAALIASYAAVAKGAALKDIGRIDVHMGRFIALSPLCSSRAPSSTLRCPCPVRS